MNGSIWITGTSSGLGQGLANQCVESRSVVGISRRRGSIVHPNFQYLPVDLSDTGSIRHAIESYVTSLSARTIDLLILNAGILGPIRDLYGTPLSELKHTMSVNVWSNKILIDALLELEARKQIDGPSRILAISSGASQNGQRGWNSYSISKAALNMMIQLYAAERPDKQWISLAPGLVETPMQDALSDKDPEQFPALKRLLTARNTPDMPDPDDAAGRILAALETIFSMPNGSYVDIRKI